MTTPRSTRTMTAPRRSRGQRPTRFVRFARHYLLMVVAMYAGMLVLDPVYAAVAAHAGYADPWTELPVLSALVMAGNMTVPMVLLMLRHGQGVRAILEMAVSMFAPTLAATALHVLGALPGRPGDDRRAPAMFPAMFLVMLRRYRTTPPEPHPPHRKERTMTTTRHDSGHRRPRTPTDPRREPAPARQPPPWSSDCSARCRWAPCTPTRSTPTTRSPPSTSTRTPRTGCWCTWASTSGVLLVTIGLVAVATSLAPARGAAGFLGWRQRSPPSSPPPSSPCRWPSTGWR